MAEVVALPRHGRPAAGPSRRLLELLLDRTQLLPQLLLRLERLPRHPIRRRRRQAALRLRIGYVRMLLVT